MRRGRDAQARGGVAVEDQAGAQTLHLLVAGHVAQLRLLLQFRQHARRVGVQLVGVGIFQRVLELRAADAVVHRDVLHRLHEQGDAGHLGQLRLQAADHVAGADLALFERLQVDQDAAAVQRGVGAVDADERGEALHRRVLENHLRQSLLPAGHLAGTKWSAPLPKRPESRRCPGWGRSPWGCG